ncbi:WecB/TagA/CpsF family glycosyltransferase [Clostridium fallax]|uniref:N-acetylglucosaminyldiphosphoundecaprenol N-acetyl-beta-D-mannosaminyltransferase n=1 Tax=Clostridium fallax TaxID=1533 RepID=A0A1M4WQB1_9CLOT|nr:WecB/TagA/CpsF family glycosyltransferase [Clostridium fallax]SHE83416.1 N-acetylglucosaminyldiphosphoundecaprenol N-acetyl-beta-D-mannosaminyltransferase [Clostridium fallax]SQB06272.1 WecB/TagA/CpsF family glycosyl transferase [Clostridium fallax]
MYVKILDYNVFNGSKKELLEVIDNKDKVNIISGNPEILYTSLNNDTLLKSFKDDTALIIPDGVGTIVASKIIGSPIKEKIPGIEIMDKLLKKFNKDGRKVYLLGAKEETLKKCIETLRDIYPNLNIVGSHNGYFDLNNCENIVEDIKNSKAEAIFIAMGCPRQEIFINKYIYELPCKIFMGVGGSFDVIAGNVGRAPKIMISLGLEWLYRVAKEPSRIKRLGSIPKFLFIVLKSKNKRRN